MLVAILWDASCYFMGLASHELFNFMLSLYNFAGLVSHELLNFMPVATVVQVWHLTNV